MIPREVQGELEAALATQPAVAIVGPRQAGKTTLALEVGKSRDAVYLDLEDPADRNRLSEPVLFLASVEDQLVILDEIHRAPGIFESLRGIIDRGRRQGKGVGRFLILGSASIDLLRQSGESLAGRIAFMDLAPFTVGGTGPTTARTPVAARRLPAELSGAGRRIKPGSGARTSSAPTLNGMSPPSVRAFRQRPSKGSGRCSRTAKGNC